MSKIIDPAYDGYYKVIEYIAFLYIMVARELVDVWVTSQKIDHSSRLFYTTFKFIIFKAQNGNVEKKEESCPLFVPHVLRPDYTATLYINKFSLYTAYMLFKI